MFLDEKQFVHLISLQLSTSDTILTDGKQLMLIIPSITTPTGSISPGGSLIHLAIFRIFPGIGVGGDNVRHYQL